MTQPANDPTTPKLPYKPQVWSGMPMTQPNRQMLSDKDNKQKQNQKVLDEKYKPLYDKVSKAPEQ